MFQSVVSSAPRCLPFFRIDTLATDTADVNFHFAVFLAVSSVDFVSFGYPRCRAPRRFIGVYKKDAKPMWTCELVPVFSFQVWFFSTWFIDWCKIGLRIGCFFDWSIVCGITVVILIKFPKKNDQKRILIPFQLEWLSLELYYIQEN